VTLDHWRAGGRWADGIGLCPGLTPEFPTLDIMYGCLVLHDVDGLLAAAFAVREGVTPRRVPTPEFQERLRRQGAVVDRPV
jgi:hypothetical protein